MYFLTPYSLRRARPASAAGALVFLFLAALIASACNTYSPTPTPTPVVTLTVFAWVESPIVRFGTEQTIHVVVQDRLGRRVPGATVRGSLTSGNAVTPLYFPVSDGAGYARLIVRVPITSPGQNYTVDVWAAYEAEFGRGSTSYTAFP